MIVQEALRQAFQILFSSIQTIS